MHSLSEHDVFIFIAQLGVIILMGRSFGEIAKRFGQPSLAGEVLAGILLGPLVFGKFLPNLRASLFPSEGHLTVLIQGIGWLCVIFLLLITGLEIDFSESVRNSKKNMLTALFGFLIPFFGILIIAQFLPDSLYQGQPNKLHTNIFLAASLSTVSVPILGKILYDLKILRSNVGLNIITTGVLSDIFGWCIITVMITLVSTGSMTLQSFLKPFVLMAVYLAVTLTAGRWIVDKIFEWVDVKLKDTTTVLALIFALALLNGAISHLLGLHVIIGAFMAGLMAGESQKITPYMRQAVEDHIFGVYTPVFFVLIGMQLNFGPSFSWGVVFLLLAAATGLKTAGGFLGALVSGVGRKNALSVATGLGPQGTMGIIVALIGVELGVLPEGVFSKVVFISILSSVLVGPCIKWTIKHVRRPLARYFDREHVFLDVDGSSKSQVIDNMVTLMAERKIISDPEFINTSIRAREKMMSTAIGEGIALPHARVPNLKKPVLCFFRLKKPLPYDSPDDIPVQLLFLELTNDNDDGMQLNLISQVSRFLSSPNNRERLLKVKREEDIHHLLSFDEKA